MKKTANSFASFAMLLNRDTNLVRLIVIAALVFVSMSVLNPGKFLSLLNIESMASQFPELGILAMGMMIAMLTGGIDLSVVGIANLAGIFVALIFTRLLPEAADGTTVTLYIALGLAVALATGALAGLLNGFLIARIGIPPILATLGTWQVFSGIAIVITKGYAVTGFPAPFLFLGNGKLGIFPLPFVIFAACFVVISVILGKTAFGINLVMMGTNMKASIFSGIRTEAMLLRSYMMSGVLASITGIVMIAHTNSAKADYGESYVLQAVLVAVLGGVNPAGGFGTVRGITIAVLSLQFLSSGFNMLRFSNFAKEFAWGVFLLAIMALNYVQNRRSLKAAAARQGTV
ncbi:MAG: ABC transporter permease [Propionivibrio sp.]